MTEFERRCGRLLGILACTLAMCAAAEPAWAQARPTATDIAASRAADRSASRPGDYIVAVVNQELVTAVEVELRMKRARDDAARAGQRLPPDPELRKQIVEALIEERVILTFSRENSGKVDDAEIDRAVQTVASQNQLTVPQLRARLKEEGIDFARFRTNLADQLLVERTREREVNQRIRINEADIDSAVNAQRTAAAGEPSINLAQILVTVPEGAAEAVVAQRRAIAEAALARVRAGEAFDAVARDVSEDSNKARGGEIGARPLSKLPDLFVEAVRSVRVGAFAPELIRSGAGFHLLKVLARDEADAPRVTQTRVRHILIRPTAQLSAEQAQSRVADYRRQIVAGQAKFEDLARKHSEDGSAAQGGDLGWASPGMMVPEFEEAMNSLPIDGVSVPVASRFGLHLIQVLERRQVAVEMKQLREQARNVLREQKFEEAYTDWARDLRARAYIEMREPPL
jgi:peptidyl-prolyl cis-trans isomerase SurA